MKPALEDFCSVVYLGGQKWEGGMVNYLAGISTDQWTIYAWWAISCAGLFDTMSRTV